LVHIEYFFVNLLKKSRTFKDVLAATKGHSLFTFRGTVTLAEKYMKIDRIQNFFYIYKTRRKLVRPQNIL